jgi:hypothetical protein
MGECRCIRSVLLAWASLATGSALAFCPFPVPKACSMYFDNDTVFLGKVVRKREVPAAGSDVDDIEFTIEVESIFKGKPERVEKIYTENASARWSAEIGERRLVFARKGSVGNSCGPVDDPRRVSESIRAIRALSHAKDATIEGEVLRGSGPGSPPAKGVKVIVRGDRGLHEALTDRKGAFSLRLERGRYRIESNSLSPTVYSRQDADGFKLQRGQCAQFQFSSPAN